MNTYNIYDENYVNSDSYQKFISENPSKGSLRIRAFAASEAIPISGLKITITKTIDNSNVIFFEGYTNESGIIDNIALPTPELDTDNLLKPFFSSYEITATYLPDNFVHKYIVNMYENICVIQNIKIVPELNVNGGI